MFRNRVNNRRSKNYKMIKKKIQLKLGVSDLISLFASGIWFGMAITIVIVSISFAKSLGYYDSDWIPIIGVFIMLSAFHGEDAIYNKVLKK